MTVMFAFKPIRMVIALTLGLTACSSSKDEPSLLSLLINSPTEAPTNPTFEALDQTNAPAVVVSLEKADNAFAIFLRQTTNAKSQETWISFDNLLLGMKDGMVIATRGLGDDLLAGDPYATLAALKTGEKSIITERFASILGGDSNVDTIAFRCEVEYKRRVPVDLGPYTADTSLYYENCRNGQTSFRNLFWVERTNMEIIQSRQWISESVGTLAIRKLPR